MPGNRYLSLIAMLVCAPLLGATEIVLKSGATFTGQIVSQTDNFFVLDSEGSRINIAKSVIARIDGAPYQPQTAPASAPAPAAAPTPARTPLSQAGAYHRYILGAEVDLVLKNGTEFHGRIISENENFVILEVGNSRVNIAKAVVDEVDGRKAGVAPPAAATVPPAPSQPAPRGGQAAATTPLPQGPGGSPASSARTESAPPPAPVKAEPRLPAPAPSVAAPSAEVRAPAPTGVTAAGAPAVMPPPAAPPAAAASVKTPPASPAAAPAAAPPAVTVSDVKGPGWGETTPSSAGAPGPRAVVLQPAAPAVPAPVAFAPVDTTGRGVALPPSSAPSEVVIIDRRYDDSVATRRSAPVAAPPAENADTSVAALIDRLRSRVPDRRMAAVVKLGRLGANAAPAADMLVGLLTDTAVYRSSGSEPSPVLKGLPAPTSISDQAAQSLVRIGPPALRIVQRAMRDPNWVIRAQAAFVLGEMKNVEGARQLLDALRDTSLVVRDVAVDALVKLGDTRPLVGVLRSRDVEQKKYAIEALARVKDPQSVEPLTRSLTDRDSYVREKAAYALGEIRDPRAIDALCAALADNISFVRANAVEALGKIGDPRVMGRITGVLRDPSNYVQEKALAVARQLALVEYRRYQENTTLLVAALQDPSLETREKAAQTLWLITGKDFGSDAAKWQAWLKSGAVVSDSLTKRK